MKRSHGVEGDFPVCEEEDDSSSYNSLYLCGSGDVVTGFHFCGPPPWKEKTKVCQDANVRFRVRLRTRGHPPPLPRTPPGHTGRAWTGRSGLEPAHVPFVCTFLQPSLKKTKQGVQRSCLPQRGSTIDPTEGFCPLPHSLQAIKRNTQDTVVNAAPQWQHWRKPSLSPPSSPLPGCVNKKGVSPPKITQINAPLLQLNQWKPALCRLVKLLLSLCYRIVPDWPLNECIYSQRPTETHWGWPDRIPVTGCAQCSVVGEEGGRWLLLLDTSGFVSHTVRMLSICYQRTTLPTSHEDSCVLRPQMLWHSQNNDKFNLNKEQTNVPNLVNPEGSNRSMEDG